MMNDRSKKLWICWQRPSVKPSHNVTVLSFLMPSEELVLQQEERGLAIISGRARSLTLKETALREYQRMVVQAGIVSDKRGQTLRQSLQNKNGQSLWWFHRVTEKDCEGSSVFDQIIQALTIDNVVQEMNPQQIELFACPPEMLWVIQSRFLVKAHATLKRLPLILILLRALLSRAKFFAQTACEIFVLKFMRKVDARHAEIFISGFWDWSVKKDTEGKLQDRYFREVPDLLEGVGKSVGWFVWFEPNYELNQPRRGVWKTAKGLLQEDRLAVAQCFLNIMDVARVCLGFRYFLTFLSYQRADSFRRVFEYKGFSFYPLFKQEFFHGFLDWNLPRQELVFIAHQRFARQYTPKVILNFLDLLLYARAAYAGSRAGCPGSWLVNMQHASCSREKTFYIFDRQYEFNGDPDGCKIPAPDIVLAMGGLGLKIFLEDGFKTEQVIVTGCARYSKVDLRKAQSLQGPLDRIINVLIVTSMDLEKEIVMVDAVDAACVDEKNVRVYLRFHPFSDIHKHPRFVRYTGRVTCTKGTTLDDDLRQADIVVFSYSTVGEEAFLKGKAILQWVSEGYNGSVFRDIGIVSTFSDSETLKRIIRDYRADPSRYLPRWEDQLRVAQECFGFVLGLETENNIAQRITKEILSILNKNVLKYVK